jgi:hypothetical protein
MARTFNRAYDQVDRILNGSGLSSIVYRQGGGRYSNRDEEFSDVEGYRPYRSKFRRGLQSLPSTAKMFINALTGKEDITDKNVSKYFPKEELSVIAELPDKQEKLISEGAIRPSLGQKGNRRGQILDRGPEAELLNYSERQTDKLLRPDIFEKYGYGEEGQKKYEEWWDKRTPILSPLMDLLQAPPRYNVANTLRKFYYGAPNLAGQRRIMDEYNYHYGKPTGSIQEALQFLTDPWEQKSPDAIKWLIETIGSRAEESGDDRKVKIDITAPPPYKDGGWNFNPQTGEYIYDQGQYHPEAIDVEGYSYDPQTNVSSIDDMAIDTTSGLKHGGQTMSRGLSGINKSININGQPHSLAWINPGEASALKAMGGSGKKVDGIPAYYYGSWGADVDDLLDTDVPEAYNEVYDLDPPRTERGQVQTYGMQMPQLQQGSPEQSPTSEPYYGQRWDEPTVVDAKGIADLYADVHGTSIYDIPGHGEAYARQGQGQGQGQEQGQTQGYTWQDPYPDKDKGPAGGVPYYGGSDPLTTEDIAEGRFSRKLIPFYNALKDRGMSNEEVAAYLSGMGPDSLSSMRESYDTGYSFGGPMGTMGGLTRDMAVSYAKKLKLKELEAEIEGLDDKLSSEERTEQIKEIFSRYDIPEIGTLTARKDFKGLGSDIEATAIKHGISPTIAKALSWAAPGMTWTALIAGAGNALANLFGVRGGFETKGGKRFQVMRGGELVEPDMAAIPTEDSPELVTETARAVAPSPEEVEKPLTGIAKLIASSKDKKHLLPQFKNIVAAGFSEQEAADMLGVSLADMLDASSDTFIT